MIIAQPNNRVPATPVARPYPRRDLGWKIAVLYCPDIRYNPSYTGAMKTAISIPDPLFQAVEQYAKEKGLSRSQLYARALQHYLETYRYHGITEALNEIYSIEDSALEPGYLAAQGQVVPKGEAYQQ